MKTKIDFITNSSSSSFIIKKRDVSYNQVEKIINHFEIAKNENLGLDIADDDQWSIDVSGPYIKGQTSMDNFDMGWFLREYVGINPDLIEWSSH